MDLTFLLAAAEHAATEEHHKSELPFFVLGALLVTYAIVVSVIGFKKPDFPGSEARARGVMAVGALLVVGALGSAIFVAL